MFKLSNTVLIPILTLCSLTASAQWAKVYTTSCDRVQSLTPSAIQGSSASPNLTVDTSTQYQGIDGFGYAITYAACANLYNMDASTRDALLKRTFSPTEGFGVNYVRVSIGCNDFSSEDYTLCDTKGPDSDLLQDFKLHTDETQYVIPILKQIKEYNPDLKIIGSPWTPPLWMKSNHAWTDGELLSQYYDAYGDYFVKFVQAFQAEGLDIYAVTHQNEPMNRGNSASCYMSWQTAADFISQSLAPKFKAAGLSTLIYLWDHNYDYDGGGDQMYYPAKAVERMGDSFEGKELVAGAAWHSYTADPVNDYVSMIDIYNKTGMDNLFTEASIGTWNDGDNLWGSLARDMCHLVVLPMWGYCRGSVVWNFALDTYGRPYVPGGCSTCRGAISVSEDGSSWVYNSHYYIMAHTTAVVDAGARRVATNSSMDSGVYTTAFLNSDGTTAVAIANTTWNDLTVKVKAGDYTYSIAVPMGGVATARLGLTGSAAKDSMITPLTPPENRYISGTFNNWVTPGADDAYKMTYADGVYLFNTSLSGTGRFCVYAANWWPKWGRVNTSDILSDTQSVVSLQANPDGEDLDIWYDLSEGDYTLAFDPEALTMSISAQGGVGDIGADSSNVTPIYYTLMGQHVEHPTSGLYLRVIPSRTEKVWLK
ncbi:MAG: glucosylceramidase [Bacteroidales bacterium]|nr:glucosylceramidase [Bacteroidales bacterium]MCD8395015.1 glucosylceramidase [Bacteroidales bacterium]